MSFKDIKSNYQHILIQSNQAINTDGLTTNTFDTVGYSSITFIYAHYAFGSVVSFLFEESEDDVTWVTMPDDKIIKTAPLEFGTVAPVGGDEIMSVGIISNLRYIRQFFVAESDTAEHVNVIFRGEVKNKPFDDSDV